MKLAFYKYIFIFSFFGFLFLSFIYYYGLEKKENKENIEVQDYLLDMKSKLANSHLWLHEYLAGNQIVDKELEVIQPLKDCKRIISTLQGKDTFPSAGIMPSEDSLYSFHLGRILNTFDQLYTYTDRLLNFSDSNVYRSTLNSGYNEVYANMLLVIRDFNDVLNNRLKDIQHNKLLARRTILFFSMLLGIIVILFLFYSDRNTLKTFYQLSEKKSEMAQILNTSPIGIFHFDLNFVITDCNPKFEEIIGVKSSALLGMNMEKELKDQKLIQSMKDCYQYGRGYYNDVYHSVSTVKATPVEIEFRPLVDKGGKYYSGIGLVRDLTEENEAKEELRNSEQKFRSISDMANDMIIIMDDKGDIEYWNSAAEKVLGYEADEVMGMKLHDLLAPQNYHEVLHESFPEWAKTGKGKAIGRTIELNAIHKKGHEITIELSLSSIFMNEAWHAVGIIRDVTDRKNYEKALIEAKEKAEESDRLKTAFLSNISHEIRTPMNGIIGFSDLLKDPNIKGDQLHYFIDIIENSSKRMLNIINDIIVISKIEAGDISCIKKQVNIDDILIEHISSLRKDADYKGIGLHYDCKLEENQFFLYTDYEKLHHVLMNLLKNAIKFTHDGEVRCIAEHKDGMLYIRVEDTGIGIPMEKQEIIFDRFMQADNSKNRAYEGAGLGLSISKAYAEILGGSLSLSSEEGKGSVFTIALPQVTSIPEEVKPVARPRKAGQKLTILIAEDEYPSFVLLQEYLNYLDAEIVHAEDGLEALSYVKNNHVDLILMDLKMPNMDGYKAIPLIKAEKPEIPIIAQTAYAMSGDEEKAIEIGSDDYIRKPINEKILKVKIRRHLNL